MTSSLAKLALSPPFELTPPTELQCRGSSGTPEVAAASLLEGAEARAECRYRRRAGASDGPARGGGSAACGPRAPTWAGDSIAPTARSRAGQRRPRSSASASLRAARTAWVRANACLGLAAARRVWPRSRPVAQASPRSAPPRLGGRARPRGSGCVPPAPARARRRAPRRPRSLRPEPARASARACSRSSSSARIVSCSAVACAAAASRSASATAAHRASSRAPCRATRSASRPRSPPRSASGRRHGNRRRSAGKRVLVAVVTRVELGLQRGEGGGLSRRGQPSCSWAASRVARACSARRSSRSRASSRGAAPAPRAPRLAAAARTRAASRGRGHGQLLLRLATRARAWSSSRSRAWTCATRSASVRFRWAISAAASYCCRRSASARLDVEVVSSEQPLQAHLWAMVLLGQAARSRRSS